MTEEDPQATKGLTALGQLLRGTGAAPTQAELERGLRAWRTRERARPRASRRALVAIAACSAMLAVALVALVGPRLGRKPVTVERIEGGKVLEGGYLSEVGQAGIRLYFSEGSRFVLARGARGRLREVSPEGARFDLDHGTASFQITPSPDRRWSVEAGPYLVSVRGTDFTVGWEPTSEHLTVTLRAGQVVVSGPVVGDNLTLRPGQRLSVDLPKRETVITEGGAAGVASGPAAVGAPPSASSAEPTAPASAAPVAVASATSAAPGGERRFKAALANGQWDRILAEVERDGVDVSLRTLSSDDLFALADAARYRRRADLARAALLAERARFPASGRSLDSSFLLGRVEELRAGGRRAALERYEEYLQRAPTGTYAAEALGRKMILTKEIEGTESARRLARDYLERFPRGSYADAARSLLGPP